MRSLTVLLVLVLAAATARADPPVRSLPGEREAAASYAEAMDYEHRLRWQVELGLFLGGAPIDGVPASTSPGYSLAAGLHRDRVTLLGEYTIAELRYRAPNPMLAAQGDTLLVDTTGILHRIGVTARYAFAEQIAGAGVAKWVGELWLEGGVGEEVARWDGGGTFARPDVVFGLGMQGARRGSSRRRGGLFVAIRVGVARRTNVDNAAATCSAVCTMPSQPAQWTDRSALLHVGFLFGD